VVACPTEAMLFGDLNDPESAIAKALAENAVQVIKAELGTQPHTFYIDLDQDAVEAKEKKKDK
jgi:Fe-S-cluster-containing dehydrogenase component